VTRNPPKLAASLFCVFRNSSGSLAIFAAIRRASSFVRRLVAVWHCDS
jgi:hypothetical protein